MLKLSLPISLRFATRDLWFILFLVLSFVLFRPSLTDLVSLSFRDDRYSHVVLIPFISLCLVYMERRRIFCEAKVCSRLGMILLLPGIALYCIVEVLPFSLQQDVRLSLTVLAIVYVWIAWFIFCYGPQSFRSAIFPLFFLSLMVPLPVAVLDKLIFVLQVGSTDVTFALFKLFHIPVLWQGFTFSLPGVDIEIAKECSGIRSSMALFIMGTLASHVFLRSGWRKVVLSLLTVPIAVFKNAVRIVIISTFGIYVDRGFFYGRLHHQGGLLFALIALAMFVPLLLALQKSEIDSHRTRQDQIQGEVIPHERPPTFLSSQDEKI